MQKVKFAEVFRVKNKVAIHQMKNTTPYAAKSAVSASNHDCIQSLLRVTNYADKGEWVRYKPGANNEIA